MPPRGAASLPLTACRLPDELAHAYLQLLGLDVRPGSIGSEALAALLSWLGVDVTRHGAGVQGRAQEAPGPNANHLGRRERPTDASGSSTWASETGRPSRCRSSPASTSSYGGVPPGERDALWHKTLEGHRAWQVEREA